MKSVYTNAIVSLFALVHAEPSLPSSSLVHPGYYTQSQPMSLFGAVGAATSAGQTNTTGDISKDVALNSPPDDSISDLRFSPVSEHLAVASWDKKVRIYEINDQGQSEGKALFDHEGPVLNCCWSPVSRIVPRLFFLLNSLAIEVSLTHPSLSRMGPKSSVLVRTRLPVCSISPRTRPTPSKSQPTMPRSDAAK